MAWASPVQVAAIEIPSVTGGAGLSSPVKRIDRNGCYQVAAGSGSASAGGRADTQTGCHLTTQAADAFRRLDAFASATGEGLVKVARGEAPSGRDASLRPILIRLDGSRWQPANDDVTRELLAAINALPAENQWHATPVGKAVGKGPQFVAVSVTTSDEGHSGKPRASLWQASLSIDGRWWCHRTDDSGAAAVSSPRKLVPLTSRDAAMRLARILQGARPKGGLDDDDAPADDDRLTISVELIFPGRARSGLFPNRLAKTVAKRFAAEMTRQSPICAWP